MDLASTPFNLFLNLFFIFPQLDVFFAACLSTPFRRLPIVPGLFLWPPGHRKGPGLFIAIVLLLVVWLVGGIQIRRKE